jgi:hypothetical protein
MATNCNFKIGDIVRRTRGDWDGFHEGDVGRITSISNIAITVVCNGKESSGNSHNMLKLDIDKVGIQKRGYKL